MTELFLPAIACLPACLLLQSWADPYAESAEESAIASLPSYVSIVCLSFMTPNTSYAGGVTFDGTGLEFG
jgi:hypothetical protein